MSKLQISDLIEKGLDFVLTPELAGMAVTFYCVVCDCEPEEITEDDARLFVTEATEEELRDMLPDMATLVDDMNFYARYAAKGLARHTVNMLDEGMTDAADIYNAR